LLQLLYVREMNSVAISKRLRFEVMRRDNFACRYCGAAADDAKLVVDAVVPEALGGSHKDPANLRTACEPCNSGKSATPPGAPLVADVAQDALRWSKAIQAASATMLADLEARGRDREQFRQWWGNWGYGEGADRKLVPLDPDWQQSVDQFIAAGLPLLVLKECIDLAMIRDRVKVEDKFRYMCGIAWSKVSELQETAQKAVGNDGAVDSAANDDEYAYDRGRRDFAKELLDEMSDEERAYYLEMADLSDWQDDEDPPQTETELVCSAISSALNSVRCDWQWLADKVDEFLKDVPGELGVQALANTRERSSAGPHGQRTFLLTDALSEVGDLLHLPEDRDFLNAMLQAERDEWLEFARALYDRGNLSDDRILVRAAYCARIVQSGRYFPAMCCASGKHIPCCPMRAAYTVRIAELDCCSLDGSTDHEGHRFCEAHAAELVDGKFKGRGGKLLSARNLEEITETAPF
jgi:HNH endonuclease